MTEHTPETTVSYELPVDKSAPEVTPIATPEVKPSRSTAIKTMVFGIVSAAMADSNPIVGIIFAIMTLKGLKAKIAAAEGTNNENFFTIANITGIVGLIKSIIGCLAIAFVIFIYIFMFGFVFLMSALESGGML